MKKLFIYILLFFCFTSCKKVLNIKDVNGYDASQLWNDPNLANAYMVNLYNLFGNWNVALDQNDDELAGVNFGPNAVTITNGDLSYWDYNSIRLINQAIAGVGTGTLSQDLKNSILGQAYFFRAYVYFNMVKTMGGVPLVTKPLDRYADNLNIARSSTLGCFNFITKDLDSAISMLPQHILPSSGDWGKIDGNFALAFKAKVLLYKASPQFNPSNPWDNAYWSDAYTINKQAYTSLLSQGYQLISDYSNIVLQERNSEVVFSVVNQYPDKTATWDNVIRPGSVSRSPAYTGPTWEMVKAFPMIDGKVYNDPTGIYYQTESQLLQSYWLNRDPRFTKSVLWNAKLYPIAGKPAGYRQYTSIGIADPLDNFGVNPNSAVRSENNDRSSGFFIFKGSNLSLSQATILQYDVDFVLMRFAEVMLDYAEAANETGHISEALDMLEQIRKRAGIDPGSDGNFGITAISRDQMRQAIMDERNVELCFEGFRFNDLRRWRMFSVLNANGGTKHGVEAIAINADGSEMPFSQAVPLANTFQLTEANFKYSILQIPQDGVKANVLPDSYYFAPVPQSIIASDKAVAQNVGWGGTFDPTIH
jgi:hypothetical protein